VDYSPRAVKPDRQVLRVPGFARLAASYTINELGDNLGVVALAILVLDKTGSAWGTAALFLASRFVPAFVSPLITARVDRIVPQRVLPAMYVIEAAVFVGLAFVAVGFHLWLLLVLAFLDGAIAVTARGLTRAIAARLTAPAGLLREGNAVMNVGLAVTSAAGPALAGVLVATASVSVALLLDAASFAVIAIILSVPFAWTAPAHDDEAGWRARFVAGVRYVRSDARVARLIAAEATAFVFFFLVIPIEVVYVQRTLGAGDAGYGALLSSWGVGLVLGSAVYARIRSVRTGLVLGFATAAIGAAYLGMAAASGIVVACVASVVGGLGNGVQWVALLTAVQELVPDAMQARVSGLLESLSAAMPGVGFVLGGALAALESPRLAFLVAGVGVLATVPVLVQAASTRVRQT
jgi:MFS family permease